jgi:hypothetical protein
LATGRPVKRAARRSLRFCELPAPVGLGPEREPPPISRVFPQRRLGSVRIFLLARSVRANVQRAAYFSSLLSTFGCRHLIDTSENALQSKAAPWCRSAGTHARTGCMRHLIIGSGPAGAALAVSLLEHCNDATHVTVLEAGDAPPPNTRTGACSGIVPTVRVWLVAH